MKYKEEVIYTIEQTCKLLNISRMTLHRWRKQGLISPIKVGFSVMYKLNDIKKLDKSK